jgi:hypothetical protein
VGEEIGSLSREPFYKLARESCTTLKAFELTPRPSHERLIDVAHGCFFPNSSVLQIGAAMHNNAPANCSGYTGEKTLVEK